MPYFRDLNLLTIENVIEQLQLNEEHPAKTFYEKIGLFLEQVGEDLSDSAHYSDAQFITIFLRIRSILQQIKTIYHVQIHKEKKTRLKEAVLLENNGQVDAQQKMYQTLTAEEQMFDDLVNLKTKALTFILNHISIERIPALIKTIQHSMIASINSLLQLKDMKAYQEMRSGLADSTRQKILAEHMAKYYLNWVSSPEQFYQFIKISNQHHFLSVDLDMLVKQPEFFLSIEDFEAILEHLSQDEQLIPPQCTMDFRQAVLTENAVVIACKNEFILRFFSTVLKNVVSIDQLKSLLTNVTTYQSTDALRDLSAQLPFEYINTIDDFLTIFSIYPHSNKIHLLNKAKSKSFYPALNEQTTIERLVQYFYEGNTNIHQLLYSFLDCFAEETRAYVVHLLFKKVFAEPVQQNVGWIEIPTEESVNQLSQVFRHKKLLVRQKGGGRGALMSNDLYPIDRIYCYEILQKTIHKIIYSECNTRGAVLMKVADYHFSSNSNSNSEPDDGDIYSAALDYSITAMSGINGPSVHYIHSGAANREEESIKAFYFSHINAALHTHSLILIHCNQTLFYAYNNSSIIIKVQRTENNRQRYDAMLEIFATIEVKAGHPNMRDASTQELFLINALTGKDIRLISDLQDFLTYKNQPDFNMPSTVERERVIQPSGREIALTSYTTKSTQFYHQKQNNQFVEESTETTYLCAEIALLEDKRLLREAEKEIPNSEIRYDEKTIPYEVLNAMLDHVPCLIPYVKGWYGVRATENAMVGLEKGRLDDLKPLSFQQTQEEMSALFDSIRSHLADNLEKIQCFLLQSYFSDRADFKSMHPHACYENTNASHYYFALFNQVNNAAQAQQYEKTISPQNKSAKAFRDEKIAAYKAKMAERKHSNSMKPKSNMAESVQALIAKKQRESQSIAELTTSSSAVPSRSLNK